MPTTRSLSGAMSTSICSRSLFPPTGEIWTNHLNSPSVSSPSTSLTGSTSLMVAPNGSLRSHGAKSWGLPDPPLRLANLRENRRVLVRNKETWIMIHQAQRRVRVRQAPRLWAKLRLRRNFLFNCSGDVKDESWTRSRLMRSRGKC